MRKKRVTTEYATPMNIVTAPATASTVSSTYDTSGFTNQLLALNPKQ